MEWSEWGLVYSYNFNPIPASQFLLRSSPLSLSIVKVRGRKVAAPSVASRETAGRAALLRPSRFSCSAQARPGSTACSAHLELAWLSPLVGQDLTATNYNYESNQAGPAGVCTERQTIKWLEGHYLYSESWRKFRYESLEDFSPPLWTAGFATQLYLLQIEVCMMAAFLQEIKYWLGEKLDHLILLSSISKYPAQTKLIANQSVASEENIQW